MNNTVAIQGELGSFHHGAAISWYGKDVKIVPCATFKDVFVALDKGLAEKAIIAIENSLYGSINEVYDLLLKHSYPIVGEIPERIHQCLIGFSSTSISDITHVYSHPVALSQCSDYLDDNLPTAKRLETYDTAVSVKQIKDRGDKNRVAIAGTIAADLHNMHILHKDIQNHETNYTRFLVLERKPLAKKSNKASLVIETNHEPGALFKVLEKFDASSLNLSKLQSRPIPGKLWRYMFYIDVEADDKQLQDVLNKLQSLKCSVTNLGQYAKASSISDI